MNETLAQADELTEENKNKQLLIQYSNALHLQIHKTMNLIFIWKNINDKQQQQQQEYLHPHRLNPVIDMIQFFL